MTLFETAHEVRRARLPLRRAASVLLAAMGLAALVWAVEVPLAGLDLVVGSGAGRQTVGLAAVLVVSGLAAVLGAAAWALVAGLGRGTRTWTVLACVVLLASLVGPLGAATAGAWLALTCLHLSLGAVVILGLAREASPRPTGAVA